MSLLFWGWVFCSFYSLDHIDEPALACPFDTLLFLALYSVQCVNILGMGGRPQH